MSEKEQTNQDLPTPDRKDRICIAALTAIRDNYFKGPNHPDRVFEALDGLAFCAAVVIEGSGSLTALAYFKKSLAEHLNHDQQRTNQSEPAT